MHRYMKPTNIEQVVGLVGSAENIISCLSDKTILIIKKDMFSRSFARKLLTVLSKMWKKTYENMLI